MSLIFGQVTSRNATVDDTVVVVVPYQDFTVKLFLSLIVRTITFSLAQTQDLSVERLLAVCSSRSACTVVELPW